MKFDKATAEELVEALVAFSRDGMDLYGQLANRSARPSPQWNDKKSVAYNNAVYQMNVSMKAAFALITEYKNHFAKKIEELAE